MPLTLESLEASEKQVYSQNGEDGVIEAIFAEIGRTSRYFVEFGCEEAIECNTANLVDQGWTGLLMDFYYASKNPRITIQKEMVTAENIRFLLNKYQVPEQFDLLSIDIDGNDFWVWQQIEHRARLVVIEYNAMVPPNLSRTIAYEPYFQWRRTDYFGASLLALKKLGEIKGYSLIYCERTGTNAFFVANEALPLGFRARPIEEVYRPPNFFNEGQSWPPDPTRRMIDPFPDFNGGYFQFEAGIVM